MTKWQDRVLEASRGSQTGAIVACALDKPIPAPCFHGKASLTSDGFLTCDFTNRDNEKRPSAFIGSFSDLLINLTLLAEFVHLTPTERIEYATALIHWIGQDYRGNATKSIQVALDIPIQ